MKQPKHLDIVSASEFSQDFANDFSCSDSYERYYYIGRTSDGMHVVEGLNAGMVSKCKYVALVPQKKYFVKSVPDTMQALSDRGYELEDERFVSEEDSFEFFHEDWKLCGTEIRNLAEVEQQGWPEWMIDVVTTTTNTNKDNN